MNDSFVDLDLIGQVHPENYKVTRPSFYAELIWNSRTQRAKTTGAQRRLGRAAQPPPAYRERTTSAASAPRSTSLPRRVGFRVIPGLGERVIYRELFPKGLTLLDFEQLGEVGIGHIAARQELREMIAGLASGSPMPRNRSRRQVERRSPIAGHGGARPTPPSLVLQRRSMTHTFRSHHPARI